MKEMVLGFYFIADQVVLVLKKTKDRSMSWQNGKRNGTGGKVRPGEAPRDAMVREHREEAGIETVASDWTEFARMQSTSGDLVVYCYSAFGYQEPSYTPAQEDEPVSVLLVESITPYSCDIVKNITWLIALALDRNPRKQIAVIEYEPVVA